MAAETSSSRPRFPTTQPEDFSTPIPIVQGPLVDTSDSAPRQMPNNSRDGVADPPPVETKFEIGDELLAEGMKWNQERVERRLHSEYERAGRQLSELVHDNLDTGLRLNSIRILGAKGTRSSFLSAIVAQYLPTVPAPSYLSSQPVTPKSPQTLRSLLNTTKDLTTLLAKFDIFTQIDTSLEANPSLLAEPGDVDIVLRVKEVSKYFLRTATDIGDGEGSATGTARIRNVFGGAETLEGNVSFGTRTKSAFQLRYETPLNASPVTKGDISVYSAQRDLNYYASCSENTKGFQARLKTLSSLGYHEICYDAVLRKIGNILPAASMTLRESAGESLKSSISHTYIKDTRDDPFHATKGNYLKCRQEFAGLGGDSNFLKTEIETSTSRTVFPGYSLSLGMRTGALLPLNSRASLFVDRYHLGGPTSVRMFRPNSMGPKDSGDYIGGDLYWSAGLSMLTPFPRKPTWPLKCHLFVNAGRLSLLDINRPVLDSINKVLLEPSLTAGVGLMYRHSLVRIEANVGVPILAGAQEGYVKGIQFGLGMTFL